LSVASDTFGIDDTGIIGGIVRIIGVHSAIGTGILSVASVTGFVNYYILKNGIPKPFGKCRIKLLFRISHIIGIVITGSTIITGITLIIIGTGHPGIISDTSIKGQPASTTVITVPNEQDCTIGKIGILVNVGTFDIEDTSGTDDIILTVGQCSSNGKGRTTLILALIATGVKVREFDTSIN